MDKKAICTALGLPEDITDEALGAAMAKCKEHLAAPPPAAPAPAPTAPSPGVQQQMADFAKRLELAEKAAADAKAEAESVKKAAVAKVEAEKTAGVVALADELVKSGAVIAANRDAVVEMASAIGLEKTRAYFSKQPKANTFGEVGHGNVPPEPTKDDDMAELTKLAEERVTKGQNKNLADAKLHVLTTNIELAKRLDAKRTIGSLKH